MMEAVSTFETYVNFNTATRRYIPEGCLPTRRRENLKYHPYFLVGVDCFNLTVIFF
jgi:hypothetical protein